MISNDAWHPCQTGKPSNRASTEVGEPQTPTKKPIGFGTDRHGRPTRLYDKPATPLDRLLAAKVLSPAQTAELVAYRDTLNPAKIAQEIADLQARLLLLAKEKTEQLYLASLPADAPDIAKGVRVKAG